MSELLLCCSRPRFLDPLNLTATLAGRALASPYYNQHSPSNRTRPPASSTSLSSAFHPSRSTSPTMSSPYQTIAPDLSDDEDLVATSGSDGLPLYNVQKGKGREVPSPAQQPALEGRIGGGSGGAGVGERTQRQTTFGGIKTETRCVALFSHCLFIPSQPLAGGGGADGCWRARPTLTFDLSVRRYTGSDTLDEPVSETIVRPLPFPPSPFPLPSLFPPTDPRTTAFERRCATSAPSVIRSSKSCTQHQTMPC